MALIIISTDMIMNEAERERLSDRFAKEIDRGVLLLDGRYNYEVEELDHTNKNIEIEIPSVFRKGVRK